MTDCFKDEKSTYVILEDSEPVPKDCATPIIIYKGDPLLKSATFELHAEGELLCIPIDIIEAFTLLLSSYFLFNISYHKRCNGLLTFLQKYVLKLDDKLPLTAGVRAMFNKMLKNAENE